jgi:hypothetical protein
MTALVDRTDTSQSGALLGSGKIGRQRIHPGDPAASLSSIIVILSTSLHPGLINT